jgi:hypothetical protein
MREKTLRILMGVALITLGVARPAAPESKSNVAPDRSELTVGPPFDPRGAYIPWRRIGLLRKGSNECPPVPNWQQEPLVDLNPRSHGREVSAGDRVLLKKLGLDRFCVYTSTTDRPGPFQAPPGLTTVEDRMAVSISAPPESLDERVAPVLIRQFRYQTGASILPFKPEQKPTVQITFIDSEPTGPIVFKARPGSQHGYTVMHLARELVCSSPADFPNHCAATLMSQRALNYYSVVPRIDSAVDQGGYTGTIVDLARAISLEVLTWQPTGSAKHLILNLSLGWDGEGLGDLDAREPSVQAVYRALRLAAKKGILVIAAAGNRRGGSPDSTLPVLPAAWELRRPGIWPWIRNSKLIYAVGGVDWQGLPLTNARRGGLPRRVAYGDHAVTEVENHITGIYTGTSISTAVVSSVAAVIWHLRPELRPDQVMGLIDRSAEALPTRADFYPWHHFAPPPEIQRVSLCKAVTAACGPGIGSCSPLAELPRCSRWTPEPPALGWLFPNDQAEPTSMYKLASPPASFTPPCNSIMQLMTESGEVPSAPCPTDQFGSVSSQPWVLPQPGDDPCPGCMLFPPPPDRSALLPFASSATEASYKTDPTSYTLKLEIAKLKEFAISTASGMNVQRTKAKLISVALDIDCFAHGRLVKRTTYPIAFDKTPGVLQTVGGFGDGASLWGCRAQLNFVVEKEDGTRMSVQNPVALDPEPLRPYDRAGVASPPAGVLNGPGR